MCSLTSSVLIEEHLERLKWKFQKVLNKKVLLIVAYVLEKNIYFIKIFPPILNSYYPMKG